MNTTIKGIEHEIVEENGIFVYKNHYCECSCRARIPFKEIHKKNGVPRYIKDHQQNSLDVRNKNSENNKGKIPHNKGFSYEELYGIEETIEIKKKIGMKSNEKKRGMSYEEMYGKEKADEIKDKIKKKRLGVHPSIETLKKMSESQIGRRHKQSSIDKIKEKRKLQVITDETKKKIRETQEGRTLEDIHGTEKATELRQHFSKLKLGKSYEDLMGKNKAIELKKQRRLVAIERITKANGISVAYNERACEFFKSFDEQHNTKGMYALYGGGEYFIKELGYFLDYINFDKKLIIEWDENHHFDFFGKLKERDVQRQKEIQTHFPDFEFKRIRERDVK